MLILILIKRYSKMEWNNTAPKFYVLSKKTSDSIFFVCVFLLIAIATRILNLFVTRIHKIFEIICKYMCVDCCCFLTQSLHINECFSSDIPFLQAQNMVHAHDLLWTSAQLPLICVMMTLTVWVMKSAV